MFKKISIVLLIAAVIGGIAVWPKISLYFESVRKTENKTSTEFYYEGKEGLEELADALVELKVIRNKKGFLKVAEYKGLTKERLAAGKYLIAPGTEVKTLLNGFTLNASGNGNAEIEVDVTFNNCRDVYQLASKVAHCIQADSAEIVRKITAIETLKKYNFTEEQLPALFIPNTYKMFWDTDPAKFLELMAHEFNIFWTPERKAKLAETGLTTPSQAVTLASIVYAEQSKNADEWPIIAGLYLNRIKQGMLLQSDPTFKFCWGDKLIGVQRLLNEHKAIDCPYNTYKYKGLPPGPISIPPASVVDAVLNREINQYIFMCAKPDYSGRHDFAVDYGTHARNAKIFQQWLAKEQANN